MRLPTARPGLPGNASHHPPRHATAEEFGAPDGMCGSVFQTGRYRQARGHFTRRRQRDEMAGLAGKTEGVEAAVSSQAPRSASAELRPGCDEGAIGLHCASPGPIKTSPLWPSPAPTRCLGPKAEPALRRTRRPRTQLACSPSCQLSNAKRPRAGRGVANPFHPVPDGSQRSTLALSPIWGAPPVSTALAILTRATALPGLSHSSPRSGVSVSRRIVGSF